MHNFFTEATPLLEKYRKESVATKTLIQLIEDGKYSEAYQLINRREQIHLVGEYQKTALHAAVRARSASCPSSVYMVEALIKAGANVDAADQNHWTPLMDAVRLNDFLMVKALVDKTNAINQIDISGYTALDYARQIKSQKLVTLLVQHGAKTASEVKTSSLTI